MDKYNPINLEFIPGPGPVIQAFPTFSILVTETTADMVGRGPNRALEDIDALAVNITNLDANAGHAVLCEFMAAKRSAFTDYR